MTGRRKKPDGLPFRLYMRIGVRTVSFFYKNDDGSRPFNYQAPKARPDKVAEIRRKAIEDANRLNDEASTANSATDLIDRYFKWQEEMRRDDERRKAESTLKENRRERKWLDRFFGEMAPNAIRPSHIYEYLDGRADAGAPAKANKEIALLSAALEYGRRIGWLDLNPCTDIRYNPTRPKTKTVSREDLAWVLRIARKRKGQFLVQALCAKAAYHAVGRPDEIRELLRSGIKNDGVLIPIGKRKSGQPQKYKLAEWNQALRVAVNKALALQEHPCIYVFPNALGGSYNRYSWANNWKRLMEHCEHDASTIGRKFSRFALADMRPTSVTARMDEGDDRITDATGHSDLRMVNKTYDRRNIRRFKATD